MATAPVTTDLAAADASRARRVTLVDRIAHGGFVAISLVVLGLILAIAAFVLAEAWPSFAANGRRWFTDGPIPLDVQLSSAFTDGSTTLRAWPAIYGTILTTGGALLVAFPFALLAAIFVAEIAPRAVAQILEPIVSLLAATPSVIFGLFAILVLAPQIDRHVIDPGKADALAPVGHPHGRELPARADRARRADRTDHDRDLRGRAARRPGRVVGGRNRPRLRPLAAAIVDYSEGFEQAALRADLFAFGAVLLITAAALTLGARLISHPLERRLQGRD